MPISHAKNVTRTVTITGTHSPEGAERINTKLSEERAAAIEKFYRAQMKKYDYQQGKLTRLNSSLSQLLTIGQNSKTASCCL
jgi:hypothetical protein